MLVSALNSLDSQDAYRWPWLQKETKVCPGSCDVLGGSGIISSTPGLCFPKNSVFLYTLLKSVASAVLKLTSAVIAIAHVRSVSVKSLSVSTKLFKY